jgi:hypothetical protein
MTGDCHVRFCERLRGETPLCLLGVFVAKIVQKCHKGTKVQSLAKSNPKQYLDKILEFSLMRQPLLFNANFSW